MKKTSSETIKVLKDYDKKYSQGQDIAGFIKATRDFEEMIKSGLVKKRGNNLLSLEEAHIIRYNNKNL